MPINYIGFKLAGQVRLIETTGTMRSLKYFSHKHWEKQCFFVSRGQGGQIDINPNALL